MSFLFAHLKRMIHPGSVGAVWLLWCFWSWTMGSCAAWLNKWICTCRCKMLRHGKFWSTSFCCWTGILDAFGECATLLAALHKVCHCRTGCQCVLPACLALQSEPEDSILNYIRSTHSTPCLPVNLPLRCWCEALFTPHFNAQINLQIQCELWERKIWQDILRYARYLRAQSFSKVFVCRSI